MRVFVAGATGAIGRRLVPAMIAPTCSTLLRCERRWSRPNRTRSSTRSPPSPTAVSPESSTRHSPRPTCCAPRAPTRCSPQHRRRASAASWPRALLLTVTRAEAGYLALLASQSSYALMEPSRREELLDAIGGLIDNQLGGMVTKEYVTVLAVAARRADGHGGGGGGGRR